MTRADNAARLRRLYAAPELLQLVNVWDVVSARAVAALPETRAIATAGHSIAATFGYPDGEIPADLMLDMVGRIAAAVEAIIAAADAEGVPFALNARTDAFARGKARPRDVNIADAIERGRAFIDAGATSVFVPGNFGEDVVTELIAGIGERRVSLLGFPEIPSPARLQELGVARVSYGPLTQRVTLGALQDLATDLYGGGVPPRGIRPLN